jgi:hypothetical protein
MFWKVKYDIYYGNLSKKCQRKIWDIRAEISESQGGNDAPCPVPTDGSGHVKFAQHMHQKKDWRLLL